MGFENEMEHFEVPVYKSTFTKHDLTEKLKFFARYLKRNFEELDTKYYKRSVFIAKTIYLAPKPIKVKFLNKNSIDIIPYMRQVYKC